MMVIPSPSPTAVCSSWIWRNNESLSAIRVNFSAGIPILAPRANGRPTPARSRVFMRNIWERPAGRKKAREASTGSAPSTTTTASSPRPAEMPLNKEAYPGIRWDIASVMASFVCLRLPCQGTHLPLWSSEDLLTAAKNEIGSALTPMKFFRPVSSAEGSVSTWTRAADPRVA